MKRTFLFYEDGGFFVEMDLFQRLIDLSTPWSSNLYKIVLRLESLNPVVQKYVVARSETLESLFISSITGYILLEGDYLPPKDALSYKIGYRKVHFRIRMKIKKIIKGRVLLHVTRVDLASKRFFDLLKLANFFLSGVRKAIIQGLVKARPDIFSFHGKTELLFHTDYFLAKVPSFVEYMGDIKIVNVRAVRSNQVHFYVESTILVVGLVDTFGPEYLSLSEIKKDRESLELLWEELKKE